MTRPLPSGFRRSAGPTFSGLVTEMLGRVARSHDPDRDRILRRMGIGPDGFAGMAPPRRARGSAVPSWVVPAVAVTLGVAMTLLIGPAVRPVVPTDGSDTAPVLGPDGTVLAPGGDPNARAGLGLTFDRTGTPIRPWGTVPAAVTDRIGTADGGAAAGTTPDDSAQDSTGSTGTGPENTGSTGSAPDGSGPNGTGSTGTGPEDTGSGGAGSGSGTGAGSGGGHRGDGNGGPSRGDDRGDDGRGDGGGDPQIRPGTGTPSVLLPSGAVDWLVPGVINNGAIARASNPQVRLGFREFGTRPWQDGPFRASWSGGTPEANRSDAKPWLILSGGDARVEVTVPSRDRPRTLTLHFGGADARVTAGPTSVVVPGATPGLVTVVLPPSSGPTQVTLAPARTTQGSHIGLAVVELR